MKPTDSNNKSGASVGSLVLLRKTLMLQAGITIKLLSERLHCSPQFCSQIISGGKRSQEKERAICGMLRVPRRVLWPL